MQSRPSTMSMQWSGSMPKCLAINAILRGLSPNSPTSSCCTVTKKTLDCLCCLGDGGDAYCGLKTRQVIVFSLVHDIVIEAPCLSYGQWQAPSQLICKGNGLFFSHLFWPTQIWCQEGSSWRALLCDAGGWALCRPPQDSRPSGSHNVWYRTKVARALLAEGHNAFCRGAGWPYQPLGGNPTAAWACVFFMLETYWGARMVRPGLECTMRAKPRCQSLVLMAASILTSMISFRTSALLRSVPDIVTMMFCLWLSLGR